MKHVTDFILKFVVLPLIGGFLFGFVLAAFVSIAEAQEGPNEYCNLLAGYAEAAALDRDDGTPFYILIEYAGRIKQSGFRSDALWITQLVFNEPDMDADQLASVTFRKCWETYGETA